LSLTNLRTDIRIYVDRDNKMVNINTTFHNFKNADVYLEPNDEIEIVLSDKLKLVGKIKTIENITG